VLSSVTLSLSSYNSLGTSKRGQLLGFFGSHGLGTLVQLGLSLETHVSTTPLLDKVGIVVVLFHGQILQEIQLCFVSLVDIRQTDNSGSLHVHQGSETSLVLDNHKGDTHLAAQSRKPEDELNGVYIVGNEDQRSLLLFDKVGDSLETTSHRVGVLVVLFTLGRHFLDTLLLGSRSLGTVLVEECKESHGFVLAQRVGKLVNGGRNLEALVQDGALALETHILGPLDESTQITTRGSNVSANLKGTGLGGKERILGSLGGLGLGFLLFAFS